jgi:hypothetical protein
VEVGSISTGGVFRGQPPMHRMAFEFVSHPNSTPVRYSIAERRSAHNQPPRAHGSPFKYPVAFLATLGMTGTLSLTMHLRAQPGHHRTGAVVSGPPPLLPPGN